MPSTAQLIERFGASNASIQKAVGLLKGEGLVTSRAGASVQVSTKRRQTMTPADYAAPAGEGEPYRWISEAADQGFRGSSELLSVGEVPAPREVAAAFGVPAGASVALRAQVLFLDDQPAELVESYYPLDMARGTPLLEHRKIKGGTPTLLAGLGHLPQPGGTEDRVSACIPTPAQFTALHLPGELVPVLRTFRVVRSTAGRVVEATVMVKAGHRLELQYRF
ncbi:MULTISPECIES: GntR family transcriptional regulator [Kitasatospora]|uniref:GntR family transcriptional regulator n=1 Tax=Kitasatospora TaxID=2063 RepID=UPI0032AE9F0F